MTELGISNLNDIKRLEETPLQARGLPSSIYEAIELGATRAQGRDALVFLPDPTQPDKAFRWSYEKLLSEIHQAASGFMTLAEGRTPTVSVLLPNLPDTHFALWGGQMAGAANPINPLLEPSQIADILKAVDADILVTLAPTPGLGLYDKAAMAACEAGCVKTIVTVDPMRYAGAVETALDDPSIRSKATIPGIDLRSFQSVLALAKPDVEFKRSGDDVAALFHTGGTTGAPKIAQLTHANQIFVSWVAVANRFTETNKSIFCGLPLFHVNGVLVTGLVSWMDGTTVVLGPPQGFRTPGLIENFWKIVDHYKIGAFSAVPTIYQMLAQQPVGDADISSLEFGICGAAPISKSTFEEFQEKTGIHILEGYGLTESACIASINPGYGERRLGTVGLRLPYQDIKIFRDDNETLTPANSGEVGVIALRGPNIFKGYLQAEDDAKAWITHEGERWYNTGDLGVFDSDGYLTLTGRKKELIIRGGHNIDPSVIEDALTADERVELAAAIGSPDPRVGEMPVAFVTLSAGCSTTEEELLNSASQTIAERAAVPKQIFIIDEMPLTAVGKIFKPELTRREIQRVAEQAATVAVPNLPLTVETVLDRTRGPITSIAGNKRRLTLDEAEAIIGALQAYTFVSEVDHD